ncbi:flagellar biosynthetic protein FliR [Escherichia coli]
MAFLVKPYFWPLLRVLALISTAPILSERSVPKRVKLGLAMMITFAIAHHYLPTMFLFFVLCSVAGREQILIGIALGFTMQFAFAAVRTAGEIIGLQMGLSLRRLSIGQPSQYACFSAYHGYAGVTTVPDI